MSGHMCEDYATRRMMVIGRFGQLMLLWVLAVCLLGCESLERSTSPLAPPATATLVPPTPTTTVTPTWTATATATATATPTATPTMTPIPLSLAVEIAPLVILQGQTGMVRVRTNRVGVVRGRIEERDLGFVSADGLEHWALFGVRALAPPESQSLTVSVSSDDGQQVAFSTRIEISDGGYGSERIVFTPDTAKLLDPALTEPELKRLAEVYAGFTPAKRWDELFSWPFDGPVTSAFGTRRQYGEGNVLSSYHSGIDIDGETGDVVTAPAAGVVVLAETLAVRGNAVIIDHGAGVLSGCYHLDTIEVTVGQQVAQGERLGTMGSTGLSTGSHLHWELRVGGVAVNPLQWTRQTFP